MTTTLHPLAEEYLGRLQRAAATLPAADRDELLAEIRGHLQAGLSGSPGDADVRNLLEGLGRPEDIVAAAQPGADPVGHPPQAARGAVEAHGQWGTLEILAVLGLTVGMFVVPVIGPLVGIVLVWMSTRWTRGEKWVATVLTALPVVTLALGASMLMVTGSSSVDVQVPTPVVSEAGIP